LDAALPVRAAEAISENQKYVGHFGAVLRMFSCGKAVMY
jgi:hypothetical protein